jgi:hypothetical protein
MLTVGPCPLGLDDVLCAWALTLLPRWCSLYDSTLWPRDWLYVRAFSKVCHRCVLYDLVHWDFTICCVPGLWRSYLTDVHYMNLWTATTRRLLCMGFIIASSPIFNLWLSTAAYTMDCMYGLCNSFVTDVNYMTVLTWTSRRIVYIGFAIVSLNIYGLCDSFVTHANDVTVHCYITMCYIYGFCLVSSTMSIIWLCPQMSLHDVP